MIRRFKAQVGDSYTLAVPVSDRIVEYKARTEAYLWVLLRTESGCNLNRWSERMDYCKYSKQDGWAGGKKPTKCEEIMHM